ncbi:mechanosensitive ion channel family protein [uncultured Treponema sp.]|uniref:mechanosensitive ion channel family protein n=1 Tax=uncultured Treponema sp. TaxID=162155 RepID=UPI00280B6A26|nr:mechanosensitive ion channel family protein [uncultured Treponema sp.]
MEESVITEAANGAIALAAGTAQEVKAMFHLDELTSYLTWANLAKVVTSVVAILIFWVFYRIIRHFVKKTASKTLQKKTVSIIIKAISYCFYILIVMYVLGLFGIKLSAIWGAAGIAGVAIGFAAQTSVSNLISGLFVVTDKAMKIGDFIEVDGISGTVDTIGIISIKIHTVDNQLVRIPNSTIINSKLTNYSALPYRRYVFETSVDYGSDFDKAMEAAKTVPARCPTVIVDKPEYEPKVVWTTHGDSGVNLNIIVWSKREDFLQTKSDVSLNTLKAFAEANVNIPFNRVDVTILDDKTVPKVSRG